MKLDDLGMFIGKKFKIDKCKFFSPKIQDVADITEGLYNTYLIFATFNKEIILKSVFEATDDDIEKTEEFDPYEYLINDKSPEFLINYFCEAFSFFTKKTVVYKDEKFYIAEDVFVHIDNYKEIVNIIKQLNCITDEKKEKIKFKNDRVKEKYKRMEELKKKYNVQNQLNLKDVCSILCSAEGNGVSVFNIGKMTIYQVYEQFTRLGVKEKHVRSLMLWANTFSMKENGKVQEWMVKSEI